MRCLRRLFLVAVRHNMLIRALHVPGVLNMAPDALSRGLLQVFRRLRPDADCRPATWDWAAFATPVADGLDAGGAGAREDSCV